MRKSINLRVLLLSFLTWTVGSCSYPLDNQGGNTFSEDFEKVTNIDSLFPVDKSRWTYTQKTMSGNHFDVDSTVVHSGSQSLRFTALRSSDQLSKCSIAKSNMYLPAGSTIEYSAWYYIVGSQPLPYLFLVDLEEAVAVGANPGMRIAFDHDGLSLEVERGKMGASTIHQSGTLKTFPRDQWVHLRYQVHLSQSNTGSIRLWQNDALLIDVQNIQTMPHDILYFIQGSKGVCNSIEVGITANSDQADCVIYLDDVQLLTIM